MLQFDHPAALAIPAIESPFDFAREVDATRVECAVKVVVSIPELLSISLIQRAMVPVVTEWSRQEMSWFHPIS